VVIVTWLAVKIFLAQSYLCTWWR